MGLQNYYDACKAGMFQRENPAECGCGGRGYFLSDLDIWFRCDIHAKPGQRSPEGEDAEYEDWSALERHDPEFFSLCASLGLAPV